MGKFFKRVINRTLDYFGYRLLSKNNFSSVYSLLSESLAFIGKNNSPADNTCCLFVFSKDRPLQLYALLESYAEKSTNHIPVKVLFKASDSRFKMAYTEVQSLCLQLKIDVEFFEEKNFKTDLIYILSIIDFGKILFIVDDNIFIRSFDCSVFNIIDPIENLLSLRLGQSIEYSYTTQEKFSQPLFSQIDFEGLLSFEWGDAPFEWDYPFSLDGHLFSFAEIKFAATVCDYTGPNSFESALVNFSFIKLKRPGLCFPHSIILNLPINKTQNENDNIAGELSSEECLKIWNSGMKFNWQDLTGHIPKSCHEEHYLTLVRR